MNKKTVLVTGSEGFIGKHLLMSLISNNNYKLYGYDLPTNIKCLDSQLADADFVFHLAGVNRPQHESEYLEGNLAPMREILNLLRERNKSPFILMSSSTQANLDNAYGKSKKAAEDLLKRHYDELNANYAIFRLPNVFGPGARPNYNSAVATFCHNVAKGLPIQIHDPQKVMNLVYIDSVVETFTNFLFSPNSFPAGYHNIQEVFQVSLGDIADTIRRYKSATDEGKPPLLTSRFETCLWNTFKSYI